MIPLFVNPNLVTDILVALHLISLAVGMGTVIYLDLRTLSRITTPTTQSNIDEIHRIHRYVTSALIGLWLSGIALLYMRTGFQIAAFSPKLWIKLAIVTLLTANAVMIHRYALPTLNKTRNKPILSLPKTQCCFLVFLGAVSAFCWLSGLALGSSTALQSQKWGLLLPTFLSGFVVMTLGAMLMLAFACFKFNKTNQRRHQ